MPVARALLVPSLVMAVVLPFALGATEADGTPAASPDAEFFERRIRPVLVEQCHSCHSAGAEKLQAGLRLDDRDRLLVGGESGPALVPNQPDASLLLRAISYEDPDLQMPPRSRLAPEIVDDFRRWIAGGAPWPKPTEPLTHSVAASFDVARRRAEHWAWQPIRRTQPPAVRDASWPRNDIDRFVLARLEAAGLSPAPRAEPRVLLRRASFALTGLPPAPEDLERFERDSSADAFAREVDRLLASPHFGERWARHWLDKVRYAETMGHEFDYPILGAWQYRDYVVRAFNDDLPYRDFAREQIAGDLLPVPRRDPRTGLDESRLATGQYWLCQQVHSPVDALAHTAEVIDNQIDVLGKAFLGLTVACARCHDHKFDAISTRDYYALFGILGSSRYAVRAIDDPTPRRRAAAELSAWRDRLREALAEVVLAGLDDASISPSTPAAASARRAPTPGIPRSRPDDRRLDLALALPDGEAFDADPQSAGQPVFLASTNRPLQLVAPGWWHSGSLSTRFQGALRSATFTLDRDFLHLRLAGRGARFGLLIEGFTLVRAPIYGSLRQPVRDEYPHWVTVDVSMWKGRRAWLEFADLTAPDPASDLAADHRDPEGWLAVGDVVLSLHREPPGLATLTIPADPRVVVEKWRSNPGRLDPDEAAWLENRLAALAPTPPASLIEARRSIEDSIATPVFAGVMADGTGIDEAVFIRGNHRRPGPVVPRRFLEALTDEIAPLDPGTFRAGSGRLALAEAVTHPSNPLFARVGANWIWSHLFGRGLVPSTDNFGVLGEKPTHPELLDWLASEFLRQGGSTKRLIREIVLGATWQMDSRETSGTVRTVDPANTLLHRGPLLRLEGESIRDSILAVSGGLDPRVGGPPVPIHLTPFMEGRGRPDRSGPLDGQGRRSLYLEVRRNFLSPFLLAFDAPIPATTVGRRVVSNVPAQSLALMNDPFVAEQARRWAGRLLDGTTTAPEERLDRLFVEAYGHRPTDAERAIAYRFIQERRADTGSDETTAWADLCHAVFNAKPFVFVE